MPRAQQAPSPAGSRSGSPPPRQSKAITQRQYREKEGECFNELQEIIKRLTGEEPQTRQEILKKATYLLLFVPGTGKQEEAPVIPPASHDAPGMVVDGPTDPLVHLGHSAQSLHWPLHQNADFNFQSAYYNSQSTVQQQYYPMPDMDVGFEQAGYPEFSGNLSDDRQL